MATRGRSTGRKRTPKQEQKRREKLGELALNWLTAGQIRDLLAAIKSKSFQSEKDIYGKSLGEWMA